MGRHSHTLDNRHYTRRSFITETGHECHSVRSLRLASGQTQAAVETAVRDTNPGDRIQLGPHTVTVTSVVCKQMRASASDCRPYKSRKVDVPAEIRALTKFLQGMTIRQISEECGLTRKTVRTYLNTAVRNSNQEVIDEVARITGLDCPARRRRLIEEADVLKARRLQGEQFLMGYKTAVLRHVPHLGNDNWDAVLASLRPISAAAAAHVSSRTEQ